MSEAKKVLLEQWGRERFDPPPSLWTLRQMARSGKISPVPVKVGRAYVVHPDAQVFNCDPPPAEVRRVPKSRTTALYRHFDASGRLLYVGISLHAVVRLAQHRSSPWNRKIARIDVAYFPTRAAAAQAEMMAIRAERPLYNKAGTEC